MRCIRFKRGMSHMWVATSARRRALGMQRLYNTIKKDERRPSLTCAWSKRVPYTQSDGPGKAHRRGPWWVSQTASIRDAVRVRAFCPFICIMLAYFPDIEISRWLSAPTFGTNVDFFMKVMKNAVGVAHRARGPCTSPPCRTRRGPRNVPMWLAKLSMKISGVTRAPFSPPG